MTNTGDEMHRAFGRRWIRPVMAIAALGCLAGCPTYQVNTLPQSQALSRPVPIQSPSDYTHTPSRIFFPSTVADFAQVALMKYDTQGLDISAGYNNADPTCRVSLTIYVSPAPRMSFVGASPDVVKSVEATWLTNAYNRWKREVAAGHSDALLQSENDSMVDGRPVKRAVYAFGSTESTLDVSIVGHAWVMSYRVSYPNSCAEQGRRDIAGFFQMWKVAAST